LLFIHENFKSMSKQNLQMPIINPKAAGIDVGSRSHYVGIGQGKEHVREFGVYTEDLKKLTQFLLDNGITTVAMESTGDYWQNLYTELIRNNLEVYLVNGKFTKTMNKKKTDVIDCQWIQKLHSLGLLPRCFLPDEATEKLRTLCRHRGNLISAKASTTKRMQKYLKLLNYRLDIVVRDITGQTGIKIISEICKGNTDPKKLAKHRHYNCRKSEEEIAKALVANNRHDFLFGLKQEYQRHRFLIEQLKECDIQIAELLKQYIQSMEEIIDEAPSDKPHKRINKNSIKTVDLNIVAFQYFGGVDLLKIPGISHGTVLSIMSEIGPQGLDKFPTAKHFTSWLRLAPNNKISGGKTISSKVPKGSNRLKIAFRNAAYSIARLKDSPLNKFYKRMLFKKGSTKAITATARKLAAIIWNMITKKVQYQSQEEYLFLDQKRKKIAQIRKNISKFGIDPNELGIFTKPEYKLDYEKKLNEINNLG